MIGTRGVPARYGGFETAVEEIGSRLAARGHEVVVTCRGGDPEQSSYRGMSLVHLPVLRKAALETLNHTMSATLHLRRQPRFDAVLVFNAANAVVLPLLRRSAGGVALHVDGLEWRRDKWSGLGKTWYLAMERFGARKADQLIADAHAIQDYYRQRHRAESTFIPYGAPLLERAEPRHLSRRALSSGEYDLVVARLEPENHVDIAIQAHLLTDRSVPLVVVGSVPYESTHVGRLRELAAQSDSVRLLGGVWDADELDELFVHCRHYVHGHSVGGTNPALLRAMGAGASIAALDVVFNREVLADTGRFYRGPVDLAALLSSPESEGARRDRGEAARARAALRYDWDRVADDYETLCRRLAGAMP